MNRRPSFAALAHLLVPAALFAAVACQSSESRPLPPPPESQRAQLSNEFTATAQVTALASAERSLTLRREDGTLMDVEASEAVRNFDQIAVGDTLRVRYKETLTAAKLAPGEAIRTAEGAFGAARAKPGTKPGAGVGMAVNLRVRIESIDREHDIVVFSLASGELIAHRLQTPEGRAFVQGLAVGDGVQLDYSQVLVLGIEKL
jgi:hypothetical protein